MLLQSRDGEGRYILLDSAKRNVERACMLLSTCVANMAAAELLALRVCAPVPAQPVADIGYLHDGAAAHHDEWLALARLQSAREHGQDALAGAEAAFGHLCAAHIMITTLTRLRGADAAMGQVHAAVNRIQPHGGGLLNMLVLVSLVAQPDARIQL
jgi:hypothetical protein